MQTFELTCPTTGERIVAHLVAGELSTDANVDAMAPETQIWWSEIVRQYAVIIQSNPTRDPVSILDTIVKAWPEDHEAPER